MGDVVYGRTAVYMMEAHGWWATWIEGTESVVVHADSDVPDRLADLVHTADWDSYPVAGLDADEIADELRDAGHTVESWEWRGPLYASGTPDMNAAMAAAVAAGEPGDMVPWLTRAHMPVIIRALARSAFPISSPMPSWEDAESALAVYRYMGDCLGVEGG